MLELAEHLKSDRSHVARTLSLVNLAPDIIMAVMSGKAPGTLTLTKVLLCRALIGALPEHITLKSLKTGLPADWEEQKKFLQIE